MEDDHLFGHESHQGLEFTIFSLDLFFRPNFELHDFSHFLISYVKLILRHFVFILIILIRMIIGTFSLIKAHQLPNAVFLAHFKYPSRLF